MHKILILTCGLLIMSSVAMAEGETAVETCAGGAGTILTGKSGYKYCRSNKGTNWWNAHTWCDALGKRMFDLNTDCGCDGVANCSKLCPELIKSETNTFLVWTAAPTKTSAYTVFTDSGGIVLFEGRAYYNNWGYPSALCK